MLLSIGLLSSLVALALGVPQAIDYGPCDMNGNPNCLDIMENTACFLNPKGANEIFSCIPGGKDGVRFEDPLLAQIPPPDTMIPGLCVLRLPWLHARGRSYFKIERLRVSS